MLTTNHGFMKKHLVIVGFDDIIADKIHGLNRARYFGWSY